MVRLQYTVLREERSIFNFRSNKSGFLVDVFLPDDGALNPLKQIIEDCQCTIQSMYLVSDNNSYIKYEYGLIIPKDRIRSYNLLITVFCENVYRIKFFEYLFIDILNKTKKLYECLAISNQNRKIIT